MTFNEKGYLSAKRGQEEKPFQNDWGGCWPTAPHLKFTSIGLQMDLLQNRLLLVFFLSSHSCSVEPSSSPCCYPDRS